MTQNKDTSKAIFGCEDTRDSLSPNLLTVGA